tara:strand:- start:164 stop:406 length:243 start_codon:yes stop_codon:yes gene_type:complete
LDKQTGDGMSKANDAAETTFDMVTPYFSSNRIVQHMKLDESLKSNLHVNHYDGGHMFYSWDRSRKAFACDMQAFYARSVG